MFRGFFSDQGSDLKHQLTKLITKSISLVVSLFLFATLVILTLFTALKIYDLFFLVIRLQTHNIVHDIAFIIVLVKAFRVLLFYLQTQHISIKYVIEISIVAPAIELIFAAQNQDLWLNILFAIFSLANLVIYLAYYEKLANIDQGRYDREKIEFKG